MLTEGQLRRIIRRAINETIIQEQVETLGYILVRGEDYEEEGSSKEYTKKDGYDKKLYKTKEEAEEVAKKSKKYLKVVPVTE